MDTIYVAKSYQNFNKVGEPFDKDGKSYITIEGKCDKCGGLGRIEYFGHVDSGICYLCGGRGIWHKDVRVYSQKEYEAMEKRNQMAAEKKERELEEKRKNGFENKTRRSVTKTYWQIICDNIFTFFNFISFPFVPCRMAFLFLPFLFFQICCNDSVPS